MKRKNIVYKCQNMYDVPEKYRGDKYKQVEIPGLLFKRTKYVIVEIL